MTTHIKKIKLYEITMRIIIITYKSEVWECKYIIKLIWGHSRKKIVAYSKAEADSASKKLSEGDTDARRRVWREI